MFLFYQKLDQSLHIWCFPLEVTFWSVGREHVGLEEEKSRISKRPVVGNGEFLGRL